MVIKTFVKDIHDFGKIALNQQSAEYSQHSRSQVNDIHVYYYPNKPSCGLYQVIEELEYYHKDGFEYSRGYMHNMIPSNKGIQDVVNKLMTSDKPQEVALGNKLDDLVYNLQKKYNPNLFE